MVKIQLFPVVLVFSTLQFKKNVNFILYIDIHLCPSYNFIIAERHSLHDPYNCGLCLFTWKY